jgi:hypothetical protein
LGLADLLRGFYSVPPWDRGRGRDPPSNMTGMREDFRTRAGVTAAAGLLLLCAEAAGQGLRFENHREIAVPDYATVRIGPFYSAIAFYQTVGWRYSYSYGAGTDFLVENRRGRIQEDGREFPMISTLAFRNYLIITPTTDLDASVRVSYEHYPMKTQQDEFRVDLAEEGVFANLSSEFALSPFVKGSLYEKAAYRTDFVNIRGLEDPYGGSRYEHFANTLGLDLDWLMARDKNLALSASRNDVIPFTEEFSGQEHTAYSESAGYEQTVLPGLTLGARGGMTQVRYEDTNQTWMTREDYSVDANFARGAGLRLSQASTLSFGIGYSTGYAWSRDAPEGTKAHAFTGGAMINTELSPQLSHKLSWGRSLATDFQNPLVYADVYAYEIAWQGRQMTADAFSRLSVADPARRKWIGYREWNNGLGVQVPFTPAVTLRGDVGYDWLDNETGEIRPGDALEPEQRADYATWHVLLALKVALAEHLSLEAYAQHIERFSQLDLLAYGRRIYGVTLGYDHEF